MSNDDNLQFILTVGITDEETEFLAKDTDEFKFLNPETFKGKFVSGLKCVLLSDDKISIDKYHEIQNVINNNNPIKIPVVIIGNSHGNNNSFGNKFEGYDIEYVNRPIIKKDVIDILKNKAKLTTLQQKLLLANQEVEFLQKKNTDNENRLKILSATVNEPIVFVNKELQIKFWNKEAENVFGFSKFEIISEDFLRWIIATQSHQQVIDISNALFQPDTKTTSTEITIFAKNKLGVVFETEASVSVHNAGTDKCNLVFVFHDIQKIKKLEKEILRNNDLHEENKILREFIHTVSHDLRTPMNAILGIAKTLLKYNSGNLTDRQREGLDIIYQSGSDLVNLIRDLLDLVRMERGKLELNNEYFDFDKLLSIQKTQVLHLLGEKPIKFTIKRSNSIPPILIGDSRKIGQVLTNLLTNAVKYTNKGKIALSTHIIENKLFFEIADTGIGINEEKLKVITNKFEQANSAYIIDGVGLGLHISSKLIQMLKGEISFESNVGQGTVVRFYITLPEENKMSSSQAAKTDENKDDLKVFNYSPSKKLFLIIDDSEKNEFLYSLISETNDYSVVLAKNGKTGLNALTEFLPDIVLLKLEIPELHGTTIIAEIRKMSSNIPVFVITDYENLPITLPPDVSILLQPLSLENIIEQLTKKSKTRTDLPLYRVCFIYEEQSGYEENLQKLTDCFYLKNKNVMFSFIQINRRKIDFLVFEQAFSMNNSNLIFKLLDEGYNRLFKGIIILHDGQPMKFLTQKLEGKSNVMLLPRNKLKVENLRLK